MKALEYEYKIKELEREKEFMATDLTSKSNELISLKLKVAQYEKELEYVNQRNHKFKEKLALQSQELHASELKDVTHFGRIDQLKQQHYRQTQKNPISESTDTFQPIKGNYLDRIVTTQSSHVETVPTERVSYQLESRHTNDSMPNNFYQPLSPSYVGPNQLLSVLEEIVKSNQLDKLYSNKLECIITSIVDRESKGFPNILNDRRTTENDPIEENPSEVNDKTEIFRKLDELGPFGYDTKRMNAFVGEKPRSSEVNGEDLAKIGDRYFGSINTFSKEIKLNTTFENQPRTTTKIEEEITMMLKALRKQILSASPISDELEEMGDRLSLDLRTEFMMIINGLKELRKQLELTQNEAIKKSTAYESVCHKISNLAEKVQDPTLIAKSSNAKDIQNLQTDFEVLYGKITALGPIVAEVKESFSEGIDEDLAVGVAELSRRFNEILELSFISQKARTDQTLRKKSSTNVSVSMASTRDFDVSQKLVQVETFISEQLTRYNNLNQEHQKVIEQLAAVKSELKDKIAERDAYQNRMQSFRELNEFLENEKATENKELYNLKVINQDLNSQIQKLTDDQLEKERLVHDLRNELEQIKEEYENMKLMLSKELPPDSNCDSIGLRRSHSVHSRKNSETIGEDNRSDPADLQSFHFSNISHRQDNADELRVTVNSGQNTIRIDKSLINLEQLINMKAITSKSSLKKSQFVNPGGNPNTLLNEIEESSQLMHQENDHQADPLSNSEYEPQAGDEHYGPILAEVVDENGNTIDIQIEAFIREIVDSHKRKVEELEGELARIRDMNSMLVAESSELKIINQKLKIETFKINSLQRENQELQKILAMNHYGQNDLSSNSVNVKRMSEEMPEIQEIQLGEGDSINYLPRESETLKLNDMRDRLHARTEELTTEVMELREENQELRSQYEEALEHMRNLKDNFPDSGARFSDQTIDDFKQLYDSASHEVERLHVLIANKNKELNNLQSDFDGLQKEYEEGRQQIVQTEDYNIKLTSRINELENQIKEAKKLKTLVESMQQNEGLNQREAGILRKEIANQKVQIKSYEDELGRLQAIISNWNQERNKYLDEILKLSQLSDKEKGGLKDGRREDEIQSPGFDAEQIQRDIEAIQRKFSHF
jgi:chromosome segregation ATPase